MWQFTKEKQKIPYHFVVTSNLESHAQCDYSKQEVCLSYVVSEDYFRLASYHESKIQNQTFLLQPTSQKCVFIFDILNYEKCANNLNCIEGNMEFLNIMAHQLLHVQLFVQPLFLVLKKYMAI